MDYSDEYHLKPYLGFGPEVIARSRRVRLHTRGQTFEVERPTLLKQPSTRLTRMMQEAPPHMRDFYFYRDAELLNCILNFYSYGELHFRHSMCKDEVLAELKYWNIHETCLSPCCWVWFSAKKTLDEEREAVSKDPLLDERGGTDDEEEEEEHEKRSKSYVGICCHHLYLFLEKPNTSKMAHIWAILFQVTIVVSILCFVLDTIPSCRVPRKLPLFDNLTITYHRLNESRLMQMTIFSEPHEVLLLVDLITNAMLTAEVVLRFSVSRRKLHFFRNGVNVIDLLACMPTWVQFGLAAPLSDDDHRQTPFGAGAARPVFAFLGAARLLRVFRLFRLVKTNNTVRMVFLTWKKSRHAMLLLFGLIVVVSIIKGSLIYFVEASDDMYPNIPSGMWWAIVTMTTVGYGDQYPTHNFGYFVGVLCSMSGLVVVATPIPIIVDNFTSLTFAADYNKKLKSQELLIKERQRDEAKEGAVTEFTSMM